jgi:hypothetical protein
MNDWPPRSRRPVYGRVDPSSGSGRRRGSRSLARIGHAAEQFEEVRHPAAAAGELLISANAARAAGVDLDSREVRRLDVRGRAEAVEVLVESVAVAA